MIKEIAKYYLIEIRGKGISSIARYLTSLGNHVYDRTSSKTTKALIDEGVNIIFDVTENNFIKL